MMNPLIATPKQVRKIMKQIYYHQSKLNELLCTAHNKGILVYEQDKFKDQSPCSTMWEVERRLESTTEKALAKTMRKEIRGY